MPDIILSTLNARYIHCSLGLRYLRANLDEELKPRSCIREFVIGARTEDVVEQLLSYSPEIIGLGVYIWNIEQTTRVVSMLKAVRPEIVIVLGGPEVSHEIGLETVNPDPVKYADFVITGQADHAFSELCMQVLQGIPPPNKLITALPFEPDSLVLPYSEYSTEDIENRVIYVEASRGCPFKCEFCLSALDKTAKSFNLGEFLQQMEILYQRGVRHFKFVDRTFNLKIKDCHEILDFFIDRLDMGVYAHFELIPDRLPEELKAKIVKFPKGRIQFEVGVQTLNPRVQELISRKQDNASTISNLVWLVENSNAHLHTDLILGLPGESWESIAKGFDALIQTGVSEIQVGILKRLKGAPISRHASEYRLVFSDAPPYNILATSELDFNQMQRLSRFARYWDMVGNSGRFRNTLTLLLGSAPFERFVSFSDWLFAKEQRTHQINLRRLFQLIYDVLCDHFKEDREHVSKLLAADYSLTGQKGLLRFDSTHVVSNRQKKPVLKRQAQHEQER